MADPFSLSALGAVALGEGVKFLYNQVTELLKRRRDRKAGRPVDTEPRAEAPVLDGPLDTSEVDDDVLEARLDEFEALYDQLGRYAHDLADVDPADRALVERVEAVRRLLELVYGRRITFRGEQREPSGTAVQVGIEAERVDGYVAAVRARTIGGADVVVRNQVREVGPTGEVVGVDADRIGD
ncbi:hypothetical protein [Saccharothrix stipae]